MPRLLYWSCSALRRRISLALAPALFLDRDGVVNHEKGYLNKIEDVIFMDGLFSLCRTARSRGLKIVIVTNQAGIGRGYYSEEQFHILMDWMRREFAAEQANIDAVYYCPHHPEHGQGHYRQECDERKPGPGMLLRASREHNIDLSRSLMIGDRCTDITAATGAGVPNRFLIAGTEEQPCPGDFIPIQTLAEAERWIVENFTV